MRKILVIVCSMVVIALSGCSLYIEKGSGNITTKEYPLSGFDEIDVSGAFQIQIRQDSVFSVEVEGDDNLIDFIDAYMKGNTLIIDLKSGVRIRPSKKMILSVRAPVFKEIETSGACNVEAPALQASHLKLDMSGASEARIGQITAQKVEVDVSGATSVILSGTTNVLDIDASGASDVKCFGLAAQDVSVDISGAGDAEVNVSRNLKVEISGGASVKYQGSPVTIHKQISGAGSVSPAE